MRQHLGSFSNLVSLATWEGVRFSDRTFQSKNVTSSGAVLQEGISKQMQQFERGGFACAFMAENADRIPQLCHRPIIR